jgi:lipopolysaccharide/colanic/teichoic acid biosynthesis glycosyltransferase
MSSMPSAGSSTSIDGNLARCFPAFHGRAQTGPRLRPDTLVKGVLRIVAKRVLDVTVSLLGLVCLSPVLALVAVLLKASSPGPILFRQVRMGRSFRPFTIYKFRTMKSGDVPGRPISVGSDPRVTAMGDLLRRTKLDELPQLFNVLKGDMSLVGPRPELPQFVSLFRSEYADILTARPGMTDLASIKYRDEAALLAGVADPEAEYVGRILPDKIRLAHEYLRRSSVPFDLTLIARTVFHLAGGKEVA